MDQRPDSRVERPRVEPEIIPPGDARLRSPWRTSFNGTQRIYQTRSRDQGETWSTPEPTDLAAAPRSPVKVGRIPSTGDLLVVWNNSPDRRSPLSTAISQNEGKSWKHVKNLEQDPQYTYAYTSLTFVDERVLLTYWVGRKDQVPGESASRSSYSLKLRSVPVKWLYE